VVSPAWSCFWAAAHSHDLDVEQRQAWEQELLILKAALTALTGTLFLEFDVPRLGSRIDAVLIFGPAVFPIEFKCGESRHRLADYNQAWDYALDLKNFHAGSHEAPIFPILVATQAQVADAAWQPAFPDGVRPPFRCGARPLRPRRHLRRGAARVDASEDVRLHASTEEACELRPVRTGIPDLVPRPARNLGGRGLPGRRRPGDSYRRGRHRGVA
jgi:hypothetical protein